jgi:hypothetical protein
LESIHVHIDFFVPRWLLLFQLFILSGLFILLGEVQISNSEILRVLLFDLEQRFLLCDELIDVL